MKPASNRIALAMGHALACLAVAGCGGGDSATADSAAREGSERAHALATSPSASPNGSEVTQWSGGSLTDSAGDVWRLNGPGTSVGPGVTLNGVYCNQG